MTQDYSQNATRVSGQYWVGFMGSAPMVLHWDSNEANWFVSDGHGGCNTHPAPDEVIAPANPPGAEPDAPDVTASPGALGAVTIGEVRRRSGWVSLVRRSALALAPIPRGQVEKHSVAGAKAYWLRALVSWPLATQGNGTGSDRIALLDAARLGLVPRLGDGLQALGKVWRITDIHPITSADGADLLKLDLSQIHDEQEQA
ncbi:MAG: hypothetical protein Alpg2KO_01080 [Alphaproteobacteria bacterium]